MRTFLILLALIICFLFSNCQNDKASDNNIPKSESIEEKLLAIGIDNYNDDVIIFSLMSLNDFNFLIPDSIFKVDNKSRMSKFNCVFALSFNQKNIILNNLLNYLDSLQPVICVEKITRINSWCYGWYILRFANRLGIKDQNEFAKIVSEIKITKNLLNKYVTSESPYFGNLSETQVSMLFDDVLNYISSLKPEDQLMFYEDYLKRIKN